MICENIPHFLPYVSAIGVTFQLRLAQLRHARSAAGLSAAQRA